MTPGCQCAVRAGPILRDDTKIDANLLKDLRIDVQQRDDDNGRPDWLWWAVGTAVVLLLLAAAAWWFMGARATTVQTAAAVAPGSSTSASTILQATGYVTAQRQATVSTQITGTLVQILFEEGDHVKKGQIIARLEDSALRATLNVAQANSLTTQAQIATAKAQLAQAEADARRQTELAASGMMSRQAAEQARTAVATYAAQLEARLRESQASKAQLAMAQVNFDYSMVRAPFSGVVTVKAAQVGEIVSPLSAGGGFTRTGVCTIVDMDSLEVDVDVSEAYIGQVKPGMPAESVLDAYPDWKVPSHVIAIVPTADRGKATIKVRVALDEKDARLVPDMGVRVSFLGSKPAPNTVAVPKGVLVSPQAIVQRDGQSVVFVVVDNHVQQRTVKPAAQDVGSMKLVPDGVKAGEQLVLSPPDTLHDGSDVKLAGESR